MRARPLHYVGICGILKVALPATVGGWSLRTPEGTSCPLQREGVVLMVTYSELFQFCLVLIGIIGLVLQTKNKK